MPLGDACHVVREVAQALHHAYSSIDMAGKRLAVVHRDVSPHNIILSYDGAVKLLDFGVAMSAVTEPTETMIVGKWLYMSPEHTKNQQIDHRSDLFSLGVILYLLCTGKMPFGGTTPKDIVRKIRAGQYKPLHECAPHLPQELSALVARLLSPDPEDRPQTGREVATALTEIARSYGIESSSPNIASFVSELFPNERSQSGIMEIVRAGGPIEEPESFAALEAVATKVGIGSGPKQPPASLLDDSKSPGSLSPSPLSPISLLPGSAPQMLTPSSGFATADISTPFPRSRSSSFIKQDLSAPAPKVTSRWDLRRVLIVITIVLLAIAAYLLVHPT
jgi:serine/threonine-protein kinase